MSNFDTDLVAARWSQDGFRGPQLGNDTGQSWSTALFD